VTVLSLSNKLGDVVVDKARIHTVGHNVAMLKHTLQERDIRRYTVNLKLAQCAIRFTHDIRELRRRRVGNHLRQ